MKIFWVFGGVPAQRGGACPGGAACPGGGACPGGCLPGGVSAGGVPARGGGGVCWGGCLLGGSARGGACRGGSAKGGCACWGGSARGGIPCDLSHHAFDVTCLLPPHQLRHINSAPAYILLPGHVTCKACWDTHPPPCEQNDRQVQTYYLARNFVCGR